MKEISLEFCLADSAYITALRLVAGAVCSAHDIDVDSLEDFKVCVNESAIILKNCGYERIKVCFSGSGAECVAEGLGGEPRQTENEFSLALISALLSDFEIEKEKGVIKRVTLKL